MDSHIASNGSCFLVTWTTFKNHLLEVGLTQNRETMALQMLTTVVGLFYIIMCEDLHDYRFIEVAFVDGLVTYNFIVHLRVRYHTT